MKKLYILLAIVLPVIFQNCSTSKKAHSSSKKAMKVTYASNLQAIVLNNCSPCHFPPKGNKKPLDTYLTLKENIDEVIVRINKNPGDKGFMPQRHAKLSDSTINLFVTWKATAFKEK